MLLIHLKGNLVSNQHYCPIHTQEEGKNESEGTKCGFHWIKYAAGLCLQPDLSPVPVALPTLQTSVFLGLREGLQPFPPS